MSGAPCSETSRESQAKSKEGPMGSGSVFGVNS